MLLMVKAESLPRKTKPSKKFAFSRERCLLAALGGLLFYKVHREKKFEGKLQLVFPSSQS
jgi:hypothetical protein